jgi:hypothetical protein
LENFQVYYKSLLLSPVSLCKILRRWIYSKWHSGLPTGSATWMTPVSPGHMDHVNGLHGNIQFTKETQK